MIFRNCFSRVIQPEASRKASILQNPTSSPDSSTRGNEQALLHPSATLPGRQSHISLYEEASGEAVMLDEKTPLLSYGHEKDVTTEQYRQRHNIFWRTANTTAETFRIIVSNILTPGRYIIACFYDDQGRFSAVLPFYRIRNSLARKQKKRTSKAIAARARSKNENEKPRRSKGQDKRLLTVKDESSNSSFNAEQIDESEEPSHVGSDEDTPAKHTRSRSVSSTVSEDSDAFQPKRLLRIKVPNEEVLRRRRHRPEEAQSLSSSSKQPPLSAATIKSPNNPTSPLRLTRYPRTPAPPRPLIPRRQPSYATSSPFPSFESPQKTLIIDLDETLIHSMAKGGRMSTGHMVEVKLQTPVGAGGTILGPQVPILYYVHKRPHCDEFLRKISKWYNLIVFTASVQEYADPVIDWLELERKYFSARYYRQHCTYRNGAYIKDLSHVEPDLSKVMILDNSPMSYIFHEDNAIPIEGWINDPTDNDLLHLIPFLEGLQHTTDVRALLALRLGEASA